METCKGCCEKNTCKKLCPEMTEVVSSGPGQAVKQREFVNSGLYTYLINEKVMGGGFADQYSPDGSIWLVAKMYWTDGRTPAEISQFVNFSTTQIAGIISVLQSIVEGAIVSYARSELVKLATRYYFYERKTIAEIAVALDVTYLHVYKSLRRVTESIKKKNPEICKYITIMEGFTKNENI